MDNRRYRRKKINLLEKGQEWFNLGTPGFTSVKTVFKSVNKRRRLAGQKKSAIPLSAASIFKTRFSAVKHAHEYLQKYSDFQKNAYGPAPKGVVVIPGHPTGHGPGQKSVASNVRHKRPTRVLAQFHSFRNGSSYILNNPQVLTPSIDRLWTLTLRKRPSRKRYRTRKRVVKPTA